MKYFLHDTSASDDEKITELFIEHGYEGIGLFYSILEKIGKQEKPIKTAVLKAQLKVGKKLEKCWSFMESLGLISSNNGDTFNERIMSYSKMYQIKTEKNREKISKWREKQSVEKNVTGYVPQSNHPKVKESKVKESKDIERGDVVASPPEILSFKKFSEDDFYKSIAEFKNDYSKEILRAFFNYWSEKNEKGKMKFQLQKTWEIKNRLITWNSKPYNQNGTTTTQQPFASSNGKLGTSEAQLSAHKNY